MNFQWLSLRGDKRLLNQDAGGLAIRNGYILAVIVDEVPSGRGGLAEALVREVLDRWWDVGGYSSDEIISIIKGIHGDFRTKFSAEKASYAIALINIESREVVVVSCGDCRVGRWAGGGVAWVNNLHTLAANYDLLGLDCIGVSGKILTRSFKAVRFVEPEVTKVGVIDPGECIFMATDGCCFVGENFICGGEDDASLLKIGNVEFPEVLLEMENWYFRQV